MNQPLGTVSNIVKHGLHSSLQVSSKISCTLEKTPSRNEQTTHQEIKVQTIAAKEQSAEHLKRLANPDIAVYFLSGTVDSRPLKSI